MPNEIEVKPNGRQALGRTLSDMGDPNPPRVIEPKPKPPESLALQACREAESLLRTMQGIPKERRPLALETVRRWMELDEPPAAPTAWAGFDGGKPMEPKAPARRGWRWWRKK